MIVHTRLFTLCLLSLCILTPLHVHADDTSTLPWSGQTVAYVQQQWASNYGTYSTAWEDSVKDYEDYGTVYLYNVATGLFVNQGGYWGTQPDLRAVGVPLHIEDATNMLDKTEDENAEEGEYVFRSGIDAWDGTVGYIGFVNFEHLYSDTYTDFEEESYDRLYMDRHPTSTMFLGDCYMKLVPIEGTYAEGYTVYAINFETRIPDDENYTTGFLSSDDDTDGDGYLNFYWTAKENSDGSIGIDLSQNYNTSNEHWVIVTLAELVAAFNDTEGSNSSPADATFLIADQNFHRGNTDYSEWVCYDGTSTSTFAQNTKLASGTQYNFYNGNGYDYNDSDNQLKYGAYWTANMYDVSNGRIYQDITITRGGWYQVSAKGFYVAPDDADDASARRRAQAAAHQTGAAWRQDLARQAAALHAAEAGTITPLTTEAKAARRAADITDMGEYDLVRMTAFTYDNYESLYMMGTCNNWTQESAPVLTQVTTTSDESSESTNTGKYTNAAVHFQTSDYVKIYTEYSTITDWTSEWTYVLGAASANTSLPVGEATSIYYQWNNSFIPAADGTFSVSLDVSSTSDTEYTLTLSPLYTTIGLNYVYLVPVTSSDSEESNENSGSTDEGARRRKASETLDLTNMITLSETGTNTGVYQTTTDVTLNSSTSYALFIQNPSSSTDYYTYRFGALSTAGTLTQGEAVALYCDVSDQSGRTLTYSGDEITTSITVDLSTYAYTITVGTATTKNYVYLLGNQGSYDWSDAVYLEETSTENVYSGSVTFNANAYFTVYTAYNTDDAGYRYGASVANEEYTLGTASTIVKGSSYAFYSASNSGTYTVTVNLNNSTILIEDPYKETTTGLGTIYLVGASDNWNYSADGSGTYALTETEEGSGVYTNSSVTFSDTNWFALYTSFEAIESGDYATHCYGPQYGSTYYSTIVLNDYKTIYHMASVGSAHSFYIATGGTYSVTVDLSGDTYTILVEGEDNSTPTLYLLGGDNNWTFENPINKATATDSVFIFSSVSLTNGETFALYTQPLWDDQYRYGGNVSEQTITTGKKKTLYNAADLGYQTTFAFSGDDDSYAITVDMSGDTYTILIGEETSSSIDSLLVVGALSGEAWTSLDANKLGALKATTSGGWIYSGTVTLEAGTTFALFTNTASGIDDTDSRYGGYANGTYVYAGYKYTLYSCSSLSYNTSFYVPASGTYVITVDLSTDGSYTILLTAVGDLEEDTSMKANLFATSADATVANYSVSKTLYAEGSNAVTAEDINTSEGYLLGGQLLTNESTASTYEAVAYVYVWVAENDEDGTTDYSTTLTIGVEVENGDGGWVCFDDVEAAYCGGVDEYIVLDETQTDISYLNSQLANAVTYGSKTWTEDDSGNWTGTDLGAASNMQSYPCVLARPMNDGAWNTLVLPVALSGEKVTSAFGAGVQVAELTDVQDNGLIINFTSLDLSEDDLEPGKLYIVKPTASTLHGSTTSTYTFDSPVPEPDFSQYTTDSDGNTTTTLATNNTLKSITGQYYLFTQISFPDDVVNTCYSTLSNTDPTGYDATVTGSEDVSSDLDGTLTFDGTYVAQTAAIPQYSYVLGRKQTTDDDGNTSQDWGFYYYTGTKGLNVSGFRGWIGTTMGHLADENTVTNTSSAASLCTFTLDGIVEPSLNMGTDDALITAVERILNAAGTGSATDAALPDSRVYSVSGQLLRQDGSLDGLPQGIYIVGGKKYVVR